METEFSFDGQKTGEKVLVVSKMHPLALFGIGVKLVVGAIAVLVVLRLAGASLFFSVAFFLFLALGGVFGFRDWFAWNNTLSMVTTLRVIQVEQKGFFYRKISESALDKIQNISHETRGIIQTIFDFGNIKVETAGARTSTDIILRLVPHPYDIQQKIISAVKKFGGAKIELALENNAREGAQQ